MGCAKLEPARVAAQARAASAAQAGTRTWAVPAARRAALEASRAAPAAPLGAEAGATGGSNEQPPTLVEVCHADLTCWECGDYVINTEVALRRVGGKCLLGISSHAPELKPDGSTDGRDHWLLDDDGTLFLFDPATPGYRWAACNTAGVISFPCRGTGASCEDMPASVCESLINCELDGAGRCWGGGTRCSAFWEEPACSNQGCVWSP